MQNQKNIILKREEKSNVNNTKNKLNCIINFNYKKNYCKFVEFNFPKQISISIKNVLINWFERYNQ
jgi:predicted membrane protein